MSREQIEEMAKISCNATNPEIERGCAKCPFDKMCDIQNSCEALYDAGYRKQSEGEWIFHKDGSATCNQCNTTQKHIWDMDNYQSYCGHCGAKMKGGAE